MWFYMDIMPIVEDHGIVYKYHQLRGSYMIIKKSMSLLLVAVFLFVTNNAFAAGVAPQTDSQVGIENLSMDKGLAPTPLSQEEETQLLSMEANQDVNLEEITAGSTVIDLILVVLLIYLILKLF